MTVLEIGRSGRATYAAEGGGWLVLRQPELSLRGKTAAELLTLAADLPGNLRYVLAPEGAVLLTGEVRQPDGGARLDEALRRFEEMRATAPSPVEASAVAEAVEAALEASGFAWSRREPGWVVPANECLPRELHLGAGPHGVCVEVVLTELDEFDEAAAQALAQFLLLAQAGLRSARCELDGRRARVVSWVHAAHVDADLPHALHGVAAGCRLLTREAAALRAPEVARAYLEFQESR